MHQDIRRELRRVVEQEKDRVRLEIDKAIEEMRAQPEANDPDGAARVDKIVGEINAKLLESDKIYDQFFRFIDEA